MTVSNRVVSFKSLNNLTSFPAVCDLYVRDRLLLQHTFYGEQSLWLPSKLSLSWGCCNFISKREASFELCDTTFVKNLQRALGLTGKVRKVSSARRALGSVPAVKGFA